MFHMDMSKFRNLTERNLYLSQIIKTKVFRHFNASMLESIDRLKEIDSIESVKLLNEELKYLPKPPSGASYSIKNAYAENTLYGYANALISYAELDEEEIFYLPLLEHGISLDNCDFKKANFKFRSYIYQGRYLENQWKREKKDIPVYFVGPYIHYAEHYYNEQRINEIKEKNGKTLLVFPSHSTEQTPAEFSSAKFTHVLFEEIGKDFDTIIACVYWANINDSYISYLREQGVKIVSAGFKIDPLFISRLKTIIQLSDTVLYPSFTTSIGYAHFLGKERIYENCQDGIQIKGGWKESQDEINDSIKKNDIFTKTFGRYCERNQQRQDGLIEKYWGISEIKTPEEIKKILQENKERIKRRLGF